MGLDVDLPEAKLDRHEIIACGLALAKTIPLQELSIVRVAAGLIFSSVSLLKIDRRRRASGSLTLKQFRTLYSGTSFATKGRWWSAVRFLEHYFSAFRAFGLDEERTATYAVLLIRFVHTSSHHTASRHWPGEQTRLRKFLMRLDREKFPSVNYLRDSYLRLAGPAPFEAGLKLIFSGLEAERRARKPAPVRVRRSVASSVQ